MFDVFAKFIFLANEYLTNEDTPAHYGREMKFQNSVQHLDNCAKMILKWNNSIHTKDKLKSVEDERSRDPLEPLAGIFVIISNSLLKIIRHDTSTFIFSQLVLLVVDQLNLCEP